METPTITQIKSGDGYSYRVCVAGMCREHIQKWQAFIFYHQAMECYQRDAGNLSILQLSQDSILDAASTSSTIPNSLCCDYAPSSMGPN